MIILMSGIVVVILRFLVRFMWFSVIILLMFFVFSVVMLVFRFLILFWKMILLSGEEVFIVLIVNVEMMLIFWLLMFRMMWLDILLFSVGFEVRLRLLEIIGKEMVFMNVLRFLGLLLNLWLLIVMMLQLIVFMNLVLVVFLQVVQNSEFWNGLFVFRIIQLLFVSFECFVLIVVLICVILLKYLFFVLLFVLQVELNWLIDLIWL